MPNRNKQRGYELEREVVVFWEKLGVTCKRIFASGAHKRHIGQEFAGDLMIAGYTVEAKRKKSGFLFLYDAFAQDDADMLVIKQDRSRRLYVLTEETLVALLSQDRVIQRRITPTAEMRAAIDAAFPVAAREVL